VNPRPMAVSVLRGVRIAGISSAVPCHVRTVLEDASGPLGAEAEKISQSTGVRQRHVSQKGACASDLCLLAAERLLGELSWPKDSVELLVFVSQTPDYVLPATSCCLQSRLGLPKSCAAFDINLGCSGFVYGLWVAAQLARSLRGGEPCCWQAIQSRELFPRRTSRSRRYSGTLGVQPPSSAARAILRCISSSVRTGPGKST